MFFGRGTFHMAGNNLMNGSAVMRAPTTVRLRALGLAADA